jgi:hypothetical protein
MKDFHPLRWASKYRRTTVPYLITMFLFYKAMGLMVLSVSQFLLVLIDFNFNPNLSFYIANYNIPMALFAGPIEETVFFGIPLYATDNHIVVMATGLLWAMIHLFNTSIIQLNTLAYLQFFGLIPSIFWSFRAWISGKGWFAIISHSMWDIAFVTPYCISGIFTCNGDVPNVLISGIIESSIWIVITYILYRRRIRKLKYKIAIMTIMSLFYMFYYYSKFYHLTV